MKETKHDYQNCIMGNFYNNECTGVHDSWSSFKDDFLGFSSDEYDDTYHFVFRYDIHKRDSGLYTLELCIMLQRKGIYIHLYIDNISQDELDNEVASWLKGRFDYMKNLWIEVSDI